MAEIREPRKANSIEKKKRIIEAGLEIFETKGYYNTNTAEIAKAAGVSTGIVYSYFKDKKDIFLHALTLFINNLYQPIIDELRKIDKIDDFYELFKKLILWNVNRHKTFHNHESVEAMSHLDEDVHHFFMENEDNIIDEIRDELIRLGVNKPNMEEKTHIAFDIIESLTHQLAFDSYEDVNYDALLDETIKVLVFLYN